MVKGSISPLGSSDGRGMNFKLVSPPNECSCRFESPDIGPVSKLCLGVAPNHLGIEEQHVQAINTLNKKGLCGKALELF